ncbi:N-acetylmuramoyl-L-alanine amidase [Blochmannia endosymbiont of Camponotus sp. C-003]|uniref:N-acetylmuramoyl-L-alanine amidase n=1 Tax=unclassified Candidatus Blochmanniella TaxID=711328 RepID=UPI0020251763|nr:MULTISPECIES: N-acetylmuramoyl-L-alanine amidase [unclassified Candidatus Blochmannia]URJ23156.1 N-acetylmuramoyl-L-alanine amidase [Blochmannia endosymbiont of Camponotus sp. C-003]URJ28625.1 N-acetylmuramoyl-L-alanine amidase [Blochmannia endosymbiont of Camponotus sp. C-046]
MKLKYEIIFVMTIFSKYLCVESVIASTLNSISVTNNVDQATVTLESAVVPVYMIFSLHNPERIVIDLLKTSKVQKNIFPINFNGINLVKRVRTNTSLSYQSIRIVLDLTSPSIIGTITQQQIKENYRIMLTILKKTAFTVPDISTRKTPPIINRKIYVNSGQSINNQKKIIDTQFIKNQNHTNTFAPVVVAIDAGHGGQDPGATGRCGIYEKNITINIAKKLKKLLDLDPNFKAVMIRDGDYFLSVMERSNLARKREANVLVSIHADSALNTKVRGASVWVLSNRRAKSEMIHWLQRSEKHSELLGGLGDILTSYHNDPYFNHLVLDLQFGYAQRAGYDIAAHVLHQLKNITPLHKDIPEYSSFGILRSPDIPSILVETGFISNVKEECLLASSGYQDKIANALHKGLRSYFIMPQQKLLDHS